jgi:uncharacterized protein (TIGR00299 family) protein
MRTLRFDSVGGASGDMILATLVDLGVDPELLRKGLGTLDVEPFGLDTEAFADRGLHGTRATVTTDESGHAPHRVLKDIRGIVEGSDLPACVKELSLRVFEGLADAEAGVHNATRETIHFHEVAGTDSIVDIVGSCLGLAALEIDTVEVGPLPLGCGVTVCGHGMIPVPVPGTVELIKGHPVITTDEPFELVTPTGAALLMTWKALPPAWRQVAENPDLAGGADQTWPGPGAGRIVAAGHGFGLRKLDHRPNLLRGLVIESDGPRTDPGADGCVVLECNLDDTIPELIGALSTKLMELGALDVFTTPVQMKKQRPGVLVSVLCRPGDRDAIVDAVFAETTTFGIREHEVRRAVLARRHVEVQTPYGPVRAKIGTWKGRDITRAPEYEDCVRLAGEHAVAVRTVYEAACRAAG